MIDRITPDALGISAEIPRPKRTDWRIGIVGFGGISGAHVPAYQAAGWRIVAVADTDPAARQRAAAALPDARVVESCAELAADPEVEVVSLLTQPTVRAAVVEVALQAGKPVLTEKPLAASIEECELLAALSDQYGIPVAVSQNYRWNSANFLARAIIETGLIGSPYYASIEIQGRQDVQLAGHAFYSRCPDFLTTQWNNHLADLIRYWIGRDPRRVFACTRRMEGQYFHSDNLLFSIADYGAGATGHIVHSELLRSELGCTRCRVDGDAGSIVFDLYGDALVLHSQHVGEGPCELDMAGRRMASSFSGPMGDLLIALEEGREPATSARRNLPTMRQILAEDRSAREGGAWIDL